MNVTICDPFCQILGSQSLRRAIIASISCQAACKNVAYLGERRDIPLYWLF